MSRTLPEASLLYINSAPRSGSTLLDVLLGNHPRVTGLGEVVKLADDPDRRRCSCERPLAECPWWARIGEVLAEATGREGAWDFGAFPLDRLGDERRDRSVRWVEAAALAGSRTALSALAAVHPRVRDWVGRMENSWVLYDAVAEAWGSALVVDSTKRSTRMKLLYLTRPHRFRALRLVRDGRAHLASTRRTTDPDRRSAERIVRDWAGQIRGSRWMARTIPADRILDVRYEDLCDDPERVLTRIFDFAGVGWDPATLEGLGERTPHEVPGNPMLFRTLRSIQKDERWRSELSDADRAVFERIAGDLNRSLGYA